MKKNLLKLIICPLCYKDELELKSIGNVNSIEIRQGLIQCNHCNKKFYIRDGILNLLLNPDKKILDEQAGWNRLKKAIKNTDKLMLSLPDAYGDYKKYWKGQAENFHHVFSGLNIKGNEIILDLGAGRCWSTRFFSEKGCYSIAQDILLPKYIGLLTSDIYIYNENTYFERICSVMEEIPFKDSVFDFVFLAAALHHSSNISCTLQEIYRVLKPNGILVIINEPVNGLLKKEYKNNPEIEAGINENSYFLLRYLKELRRTGFTYNLEFWLGGNKKITLSIDKYLKKVLPDKYVENFFWKPLKFLQLLLSGGVLNLKAIKTI